MLGILFHYEENKADVQYRLWDEFMATWGFDLLIMIDKDTLYSKGIGKGRRKNTYKSIEEAMPNYDATYIAMDPQGGINLKDFDHPKDNVIYVIGANSWRKSQIPDEMTKVRIDTPSDSTERPLTDISAAICLVYDRNCKLG